ncbi:MAG: hypothetical protein WCK58_19220, partial [Chloroflexota bacterium]
DLPAADLGRFVERNEVALVALSANSPDLVGELAQAIGAVRTAAGGRPIGVIVGGGVAWVPNLQSTVEADGVAHSITEAQALTREHRPAS